LTNQPLRCIQAWRSSAGRNHDLVAIKTRFAQADTLEVTRSAIEGARALGYSLEDVALAVQALESRDFIKSETAHSPRNSRVWHDTYNTSPH